MRIRFDLVLGMALVGLAASPSFAGTTRYVSTASTVGDTGSCTPIANACASLAYATSATVLGTSDTVQIQGGTYTATATAEIYASGASAATPIIIEPAPGANVTIKMQATVPVMTDTLVKIGSSKAGSTDGQYVTIEGVNSGSTLTLVGNVAHPLATNSNPAPNANGIAIDPSATGAIVDGVTASYFGDNGFVVYASGATVSNSEADHNWQAGIAVQGDNVTLDADVVTQNEWVNCWDTTQWASGFPGPASTTDWAQGISLGYTNADSWPLIGAAITSGVLNATTTGTPAAEPPTGADAVLINGTGGRIVAGGTSPPHFVSINTITAWTAGANKAFSATLAGNPGNVASEPMSIGHIVTGGLIEYSKAYDNWGEGIGVHRSTGVAVQSNQSFENWSIDLYIETATWNKVIGNLVYTPGTSKFPAEWTGTYNESNNGTTAVFKPPLGINEANEAVTHPNSDHNSYINNVTFGTKTGFQAYDVVPTCLQHDNILGNTFIAGPVIIGAALYTTDNVTVNCSADIGVTFQNNINYGQSANATGAISAGGVWNVTSLNDGHSLIQGGATINVNGVAFVIAKTALNSTYTGDGAGGTYLLTLPSGAAYNGGMQPATAYTVSFPDSAGLNETFVQTTGVTADHNTYEGAEPANAGLGGGDKAMSNPKIQETGGTGFNSMSTSFFTIPTSSPAYKAGINNSNEPNNIAGNPWSGSPWLGSPDIGAW